MTFFQIIKRDLIHYRRSLLATVLLAMVCSIILTGALLVGDSVRSTLKNIAHMRLGKIQFACSTGDRFFRQELADNLNTKSSNHVAPVLALKGILETPDGSVRVNNVNVYGIDKRFWELSKKPPEPPFADYPGQTGGRDTLLMSESVKSRLGDYGDTILLRIKSGSILSQDLIFSTETARSEAFPFQSAEIVPDENMGRFSLQASQTPPLNVFVPIEWLAEKIGQPKKANLLLVANGWLNLKLLQSRLKEVIKLEDLGFQLHTIAAEDVIELRTPRIFIDKSIADAALKTGSGAYGVFTHLVNEIRFKQKTIPYSMVSAIGTPTNTSLGENEIVINEWLAYELKADVGDVLELTYYKLADTRKLVEETTAFTVSQVVPMMGSYADPTLMPDYPGMSEVKSCRQWKSGLPIDMDKIRPRDEAYWDKYKGTPKAYVSMAAAKNLWANRFGTLTAVRWPASRNTLADIRAELQDKLDPSQVGFAFRDVQTAAKKSAAGSTDFSGLFAGLSMFLILSAAVLLALGFAFYIESRSEHIGLLRAVGWHWLRIFLLFMAEGAVLAFVGCLAGAVVSVLYTYSVIAVLNTTFWSNALASLHVDFGISLATFIEGIFVSVLICVFAMQVALFRRLRRPVHQLLSGTSEESYPLRKRKDAIIHGAGWVCLLGGIFISLRSGSGQAQVSAFFSAGLLSLTGVLMILSYWLKWLRLRSGSFARSLEWVAVKNLPRRLSRTLAVLISLSAGIFLVVSVGANYKNLESDMTRRQSGTGGFALMAQTTMPIPGQISLSADKTRQVPGVAAADVLAIRIYQQDDASCLNLNRAQSPTLLGVNVGQIQSKNPFTFQAYKSAEKGASPWSLLTQAPADGSIPVIGDYATVYWGLGTKLGGTIDMTDEKGNSIRLKVVGILKESVLQGRLLMSEAEFVRHFPSVDGYGLFLIDANSQDLYLQARELSKHYRDAGMEVISTAEKLAQFNEVENTYLMIFLVLGGLGLILGSFGLGFVLTLNVLDRRGELALMQAVGFRPNDLRYMLLIEHSILLVAGILCGVVPALWAVWPAILTQGKQFPIASIVMILLAMLVCGVIWIQLAATVALRKTFLDVLRNQ